MTPHCHICERRKAQAGDNPIALNDVRVAHIVEGHTNELCSTCGRPWVRFAHMTPRGSYTHLCVYCLGTIVRYDKARANGDG